jgi:hypothetical protein
MVAIRLDNIEIETQRKCCCLSATPFELKLIAALDYLNKAGQILFDIDPFDAEMDSWQYEINIIYASMERRLNANDSK